MVIVANFYSYGGRAAITAERPFIIPPTLAEVCESLLNGGIFTLSLVKENIMLDDATLHEYATKTLDRLLPRITPHLGKDSKAFLARLHQHFPRAFRLLHALYGDQYDFFYHLEQILLSCAHAHATRPKDLKKLDDQRAATPDWFLRAPMVGGVCYVDLFAGNLAGLRDKLPYFKELGLTYLHLMPLFKAPEKESDGGYAVSDYRTVNPSLGTMAELAELATAFRKQGISLVLDFVFNHTSHEHEWAQKALAGDRTYQGYYYFFPDRAMPDAYERTLREIFPEQAAGNFTYQPAAQSWVWTTFREFQWDLNYGNPAVFNAMLGELLFLANHGVEVLRLDAVAFIWKQLGTSCESLPQAHWLIQAFNAFVQIATPAMTFKSEAIVHPDIVATYIGTEECPISYNPTLMALLWEALATRNVTLLSDSMQRRFAMPEGCAWVNYVRCHDDIGWTFADEDAVQLGINGFYHRQFLNSFYTGQFSGSFARGVPFNYNPVTHDMRISGMGASLAGLELALAENNAEYTEHALKRLRLIHSIILSVQGIPLIYLGDELATLNDYSYQQDAGKAADSRWVHRPRFDWQRAEQRNSPQTPAGYLFQALRQMVLLRQREAAFLGETRFFWTSTPHVLGYVCGGRVCVLANFSEHRVEVAPESVRNTLPTRQAKDLLTQQAIDLTQPIVLGAYDVLWLTHTDET